MGGLRRQMARRTPPLRAAAPKAALAAALGAALALLGGAAALLGGPAAARAGVVNCATFPAAWGISDAATQCLELSTTAGPFRGLLLEGAAAPSVGVVFFHGRGLDPNSEVVGDLRRSLNGLGYTTLSLEDPVPAGGTAFSDYVADVTGPNVVFPEAYARIGAAMGYLAGLGVDRVVIGGFSLGSRLASAYVGIGQAPGDLDVLGLMGFGLYANSIDPLNVAGTLDDVGALGLPVLDLYGHVDTNAVNTAAARLAAYTGGGGAPGDYTQVVLTCPPGVVDNACHRLNGLRGTPTSPLETAVAAWIGAVAPIPEPSTLTLLAAGLLGAGMAGRPRARQRRAAS